MTPFLLYCAEKRAAAAAADGKALLVKDLAKQASVEWKGMSDVEKAPLQAKYDSAIAGYKERMGRYRDSGALAGWKRDPAKPKKPLTSYMKFMGDYRIGAGVGLPAKEMVSTGAKMWNSLADKSKYEAGLAAEQASYQVALKAYQESGAEAAWKEKVGFEEPRGAAKAKEAKAKEKAKLQAAKEKAKASKAKAAEKAKEAKAKEKTKLIATKDKARTAAVAEKARDAKAKLREKEQAQRLKVRALEAAARAKAKLATMKR